MMLLQIYSNIHCLPNTRVVGDSGGVFPEGTYVESIWQDSTADKGGGDRGGGGEGGGIPMWFPYPRW